MALQSNLVLATLTKVVGALDYMVVLYGPVNCFPWWFEYCSPIRYNVRVYICMSSWSTIEVVSHRTICSRLDA